VSKKKRAPRVLLEHDHKNVNDGRSVSRYPKTCRQCVKHRLASQNWQDFHNATRANTSTFSITPSKWMSEARQQKTGWCRACHHARKMYYESPFLWPPPHTPGSAITQKNKRRRPVHRKELLQKNASTGTCVNPAFAITPGNTNKKARVPHSSHENTKTPTRCRRQKQAFTKSIRHERIDGLTQLWQWRRKKKSKVLPSISPPRLVVHNQNLKRWRLSVSEQKQEPGGDAV